MKKEDLQYIKETLEYALNDCPVKDGDHETHFNTFANAISLVDDELNLLTIPNVSKPYYKGKWYYFGKCKPYPVQVDGYPVKPYKQFDTKEECQSYIDSAC